MNHHTSFNEQKIVAVFIDADNVSSQYIAEVMNIAKKFGKVTIKRVYANWAKPNMSTWRDVCTEYALNAIQQFDHVTGKNASDMAVSVDVMDFLYRQNIDVFCLVSGDSDFTPLCTKLREYDKTVIGFGAKNSSKSLINACHHFHYLIKEKEHSPPPPVIHQPVDAHEAKHRPNPNHDKRLIAAIKKDIDEQGKDGLLNTAILGQTLRQHIPDFSPSYYGYDKIADMLAAMGMFSTVTQGTTLFVSKCQNQSRPTEFFATPTGETIQSALSPEGLLADTVLTNALSNAIALLQINGLAEINKVKDYLHDTFGIVSQKYGYANIIELIKNLSTLFEIHKQQGVWYVQDKRTKPQEPKTQSQSQSQTNQNTTARKSPVQLRKDTTLCQALKDGVAKYADDKGFANLAMVGSHVRNSGFSPKHYGYRNLTELVKAIDIFDINAVNSTHFIKDPTAKVARKPTDIPTITNTPTGDLQTNSPKDTDQNNISPDDAAQDSTPKIISQDTRAQTDKQTPPTFSKKYTHGDITEQLALLLSETDETQTAQEEDELSINDAVSLVIRDLLGKGKAIESNWVKVADISAAIRKTYDVKVSELGFTNFADLLADLPEFDTQKQGRIWLARLADDKTT